MKNAVFIFDFLPNKLSTSITFEILSHPNGRTALAAPVVDQFWTVSIQREWGL